MNKFRKWISKAKSVVESNQSDNPDTLKEVESLLEPITDLNFPGLAALLAMGKGKNDFDTDPLAEARKFIHSAATEIGNDPEIKKAGLEEPEIRDILKKVFVQKVKPQQVLRDEKVRQKLLNVGIDKLAQKAGAPLSPAETSQVIHLLETGEFFKDIDSATAAVVGSVPGIPLDVAKDVFSGDAVENLPELMKAIVTDIGASPVLIKSVLVEMKNTQTIESPPGVMTNTLSALYEFSGPEATAKTVRSLIGYKKDNNENKTVRTAILIYARANGINLENEDLDAVYIALDPNNPDLAPLLDAAAGKIRSKYGGQAGKEFISKFL